MNTKEIIEEFKEVVEGIEILYCDCIWAFHGNRESVENLEKSDETSKTNILEWLKSNGIKPNTNPSDFLDTPFPFNYGATDNEESRRTKSFTFRDFKERNSQGGENFRFIGNMCIVQVYEYWENHYRREIAHSQRKIKNDLKLGIFGDLRKLRQAILHRRGIATRGVANAEILKWFKEDEILYFDTEKIKCIFKLVFQELDTIVDI